LDGSFNKVLESADVLCSIDDRSSYHSHAWLFLLGAASEVLLSSLMTDEFGLAFSPNELVTKVLLSLVQLHI
jgi:hypothetical protein